MVNRLRKSALGETQIFSLQLEVLPVGEPAETHISDALTEVAPADQLQDLAVEQVQVLAPDAPAATDAPVAQVAEQPPVAPDPLAEVRVLAPDDALGLARAHDKANRQPAALLTVDNRRLRARTRDPSRHKYRKK